MRKKLLAITLSLAMALSVVPAALVYAAGYGADPGNTAYHWFYNQLTPKAMAVYDLLELKFEAGEMAGGNASFDLIAGGAATAAEVQAYLDGDRTLFDAFAAAKDAFDLEHPEAWYIDSSDLCLRVLQGEDGSLQAMVGIGRTDEYYVDSSLNAASVATMSRKLEDAIGEIVAAASGGSDFEKIRQVHKQITEGISYRFETDCLEENISYVRTAYGIVTHEGVCEAYVRSFQMAMNALGIPCVPVHGIQASGTPEAHMWCAVMADGKWYVVDPTWDDPVGMNADGSFRTGDGYGNDGFEREKYLMVGLNVVGTDWREQGVVSSGGFEFSYPEIETFSYNSLVSEDGSLIVEQEKSTMDGYDSMLYKVSFNGDGLVNAAKKGYYFLLKMYDVNADGSVDEFDDWYYPVHMLHSFGFYGDFDPDNTFEGEGNPYFRDNADYLEYNVSNCEYVEFAVTTKAPPNWQKAEDLVYMGGYYSGDYSDIIAESGLIYNEFGGYEQTPYITNFSPAMTEPVYSGREYTIHVEFTDDLYRPARDGADKTPGEDENDDYAVPYSDGGFDLDVSDKVNDKYIAADEDIGVDFTGTTYSWGMLGQNAHNFAQKPPIVDLRYLCRTHGEQHGDESEIDDECRIYGVEYEFTASKAWRDNSIYYSFHIDGLVGVKSNKKPTNWGWVFESVYPYATCPLCSPFKWNMWGQPSPLANPDGLDFESMIVEGVDGSRDSIAGLMEQVHMDPYDMNGRIMMVMENIVNDTPAADLMAEKVAGDLGAPTSAIEAKSIYEIDFTRVCGKTIVETGQSVRICVGFPEGIDASMAGLVFKAYHFVLDTPEHCEKPAPHKGHNHSGDIKSVEEIPCTVTQYGLVITCMNFSPFMIAAIDAKEAGIDVPEETARTLFISADGHGKILVNGKSAGMLVEFGEGEEYTFRIAPDEGYTFDTLSFSGYGEVDPASGEFVLKYNDIPRDNALLEISFAAESVKQAEEESGLTVVAPAVDIKADEAAPPAGGGHGSGSGSSGSGSGGSGSGSGSGGSGSGSSGSGSGSGGSGSGSSGSGSGGSGSGSGSGGSGSGGSGSGSGSGGSGSGSGGSGSGSGSTTGTENGNQANGGGSYAGLPTRFTDVYESDWYYSVMADMYRRGLIYGVTDTEMRPMFTSTRAQIVTVLWRAAGSPGARRDPEFSDIGSDMWYYSAIKWAAEAGVTTGYNDGTFGANDNITREQMIVMLYRFWTWQNGGDVPLMRYRAEFSDMNQASAYAGMPIGWAQYYGIVRGDGGRVIPKAELTRAEMAAMISGYLTWREGGTS